jgi:hypothetical protein
VFVGDDLGWRDTRPYGSRTDAANLRATRDLLLPRLMSGQLTLPEAEEAIPAAL